MFDYLSSAKLKIWLPYLSVLTNVMLFAFYEITHMIKMTSIY